MHISRIFLKQSSHNRRTKAVMESINVAVDDQGSISAPTRSDDSDVEFIILNEYNRKSSQTSSVTKDGPLSDNKNNSSLEMVYHLVEQPRINEISRLI